MTWRWWAVRRFGRSGRDLAAGIRSADPARAADPPATQLAEAGPGSDNRAVLLPGSAHAQNIFDTDHGETVVQLILDRLAEVDAP